MPLPRRFARIAWITLVVVSLVVPPERGRLSEAATPPTRHVGGAAAVVVDGFGNVAVAGTDLSLGPLRSRLFVEKRDASGALTWSKTFPATDSAPDSVAFDPAGDVVVTGHYVGTIDFGGAKFMTGDEPHAYMIRLGPGGALHFSASSAAVRAVPIATASSWSSLRFKTASSPVNRM